MNLILEKEINADQKTCYQAFILPAHLSRWFTSNAVSDLKPGGRYSNDDKDEGTFLELKPFELVKFTWENKEHCPGTEVETKFTSLNENMTKVILTHSLFTTEKQIEDMKKGWTWALENLKTYIETGKTVSFEDWEKSLK